MNKEVKTETKKTNKTLVNLLAGIVVAVIATASSYNYWHDTNIRVTFHADSEKDIQYQIFYSTEEYKGYHEDRSVRKNVLAGENYVKMVLPTNDVNQIRFDIGYKPGKVKISELKISGNEVIELSDFDDYKYNKIDNHVVDDGSLTIISDKDDPFIITTGGFSVLPGDDYDWHRMGLIAGGSFIVAFLLAMLINRKKK